MIYPNDASKRRGWHSQSDVYNYPVVSVGELSRWDFYCHAQALNWKKKRKKERKREGLHQGVWHWNVTQIPIIQNWFWNPVVDQDEQNVEVSRWTQIAEGERKVVERWGNSPEKALLSAKRWKVRGEIHIKGVKKGKVVRRWTDGKEEGGEHLSESLLPQRTPNGFVEFPKILPSKSLKTLPKVNHKADILFIST